MIEVHLNHAAGVAQLLVNNGITVLRARANPQASQLLIQGSLPEFLIEQVEETSELGQLLFGTWVKQYESKSEAQ